MKAFKQLTVPNTTSHGNKQVFHFVNPNDVPNHKENLVYRISTYDKSNKFSNSPYIINYNRIKYDSDGLYDYFIIVNNEGRVIRTTREDIINENKTGIYPNYDIVTKKLSSFTIKIYEDKIYEDNKIKYEILIPIISTEQSNKYQITVAKYEYSSHIREIYTDLYTSSLEGIFGILNSNTLISNNGFNKIESKSSYVKEEYDENDRILSVYNYRNNSVFLICSYEYDDINNIEKVTRNRLYEEGNFNITESIFDSKSRNLLKRIHLRYIGKEPVSKCVEKYLNDFIIHKEEYKMDKTTNTFDLIENLDSNIIYFED